MKHKPHNEVLEETKKVCSDYLQDLYEHLRYYQETDEYDKHIKKLVKFMGYLDNMEF